MRIIIASTIVPFIEGGGTFIVDWLAKALTNRGFMVDVLKIPFHSVYEKMPEQMLGLRLMDLSEAADLLITIRTPSYILKHPNKVAWFIHHHRTAYDLWGTEYQEFPNTERGLIYRQFMIDTDNKYLREAKKIFTNSKRVGDRLRNFNQIESTVLYPPLLEPEKFVHQQIGDYIFYPSRITGHKRQLLVVESMRYTQSNARLIIAGNQEQASYAKRIKDYIDQYKLHHKVTFIDRWISEAEKIDLVTNSLAGVYIPFDEDSYGYPTLEFFHSKKPMITCQDSGGTIEIIQDGFNGYVCEPTPQAIAEKIDKLYLNKENVQKLGENAHQSIYDFNITWDHVIESFTK